MHGLARCIHDPIAVIRYQRRCHVLGLPIESSKWLWVSRRQQTIYISLFFSPLYTVRLISSVFCLQLSRVQTIVGLVVLHTNFLKQIFRVKNLRSSVFAE